MARPGPTRDASERAAADAATLPRTLIMGIGNTLQGDDGVGVHAVRHLQQTLGEAPDLSLCDAGTLGTTLLVEIESSQRLIMIDAMRMGAEPGAVRCFENGEMDAWLRRGKAGSVHEVGLGELIDLARLRECLPDRRALIGIEPGYIGWGDRLSKELDDALPRIDRHVRDLLRSWGHGDA